jgi:uncharacterized membrane protein YfcA
MQLPLMVAAGILVGLLASFVGLGGGFLVVPLLLYLGYTPPRAVGTSFLAILIVSASALFGHGRMDHVDYRVGIALGVGGILGAQVGPRLLAAVPAGVFQKVFAVLLAALAVQMFFKK